ncbi:diacylglycerol kinase family protein [Paraflavitalea sp. CAU 1676]|uniref:diacylglycerol/lipid kinase family protein n=1 Tax=Paraflavitalea sp. CAU 1676 TaxID=3032598 RepID=UPI0023DA19F3|nr:diacylglycerol kinase family protein [Paraflavitalea sp. CAU 1676]MDF2192950.1 diacylglycerol kinase family protein [Paraflavitalea sp. CAU 1676]
MEAPRIIKLLFIVNHRSGTNSVNWRSVIGQFYRDLLHTAEVFELPDHCQPAEIKQKIDASGANRIVAVGGDGTVKLVADVLAGTGIPMGIVPAGSANGMARELGIPTETTAALEVATEGLVTRIDAIRINGELCIHLSDIGFNAFVIKTFESMNRRGMWGYIKAAWYVLWRNRKMQVKIETDNQFVKRAASMIVLANASRYGTGAVINPEGKLNDGFFEIVVLRKIAIGELFKMMVSHKPYDPSKTELFKTRSVTVQSRHKTHFQVDGEYLGKVNAVEAAIEPHALSIIVPVENN